MSIKILKPKKAAKAYDIAADEFKRIWYEISEKQLEIITEDDGKSDLVIIGSDAVNSTLAQFMLDGEVSQIGIRCTSDDYAIISQTAKKRRFLILAGGRGRSTLYAVYGYFEKAAGCRYFWDGDLIPKGDEPSLEGFSIVERSRFQYRGLRYFAHRSLHRFQAEHWSLEDWKKEICWMVKKRLNLFMLRIGMDDLFQKAFPDVVEYPKKDERLPEALDGFDDRTTFWTLEYRGELRKKLLAFARDRDLLHIEDSGTMTHWYSRTPIQYLERKKPKLISQSTEGYSEATGLVWDVLDNENLENYFHLTKTHIKEYGAPDIFHTIGFAERKYSQDREKNLRMKTYIYRRIENFISESYPNAKLLIASWDLWHQYTKEEVSRLVKELNPEQSIIFDYTSDSPRDNTFINWDIVGKFPWIFGIFHGYEPDSDIRGNYRFTEERLKIAKDDSLCKGMILWPELSHSDTFMTEYFAKNAWAPLQETFEERISAYCRDRYGKHASYMEKIWHSFMPFVNLQHWDTSDKKSMRSELFFDITVHFDFESKLTNMMEANRFNVISGLSESAFELLNLLLDCDISDGFTKRDVYDITRTLVGRYIDYEINTVIKTTRAWLSGENVNVENIKKCADGAIALLEVLTDLMSSHSDYSMLETLKKLQETAYVNPVFETTLKNNASCSYCRSYIYENARMLYIPEAKLVFKTVIELIENGKRDFECPKEYRENRLNIIKEFYDTPLSELAPRENLELKPLIKRAFEIIKALV